MVVLLKSPVDLVLDLILHPSPHNTLIDQQTETHKNDEEGYGQQNDETDGVGKGLEVLRKLLARLAVIWHLLLADLVLDRIGQTVDRLFLR